jgi:hypothetical protein
MLTHPSILGRLLFSFVVCLLLCATVSAEVPELLSLTDNASNDFTISKAGGLEGTPPLGTAIHKSAPVDMKNFECGARAHCAAILADAETISSDLFVLRR